MAHALVVVFIPREGFYNRMQAVLLREGGGGGGGGLQHFLSFLKKEKENKIGVNFSYTGTGIGVSSYMTNLSI